MTSGPLIEWKKKRLVHQMNDFSVRHGHRIPVYCTFGTLCLFQSHSSIRAVDGVFDCNAAQQVYCLAGESWWFQCSCLYMDQYELDCKYKMTSGPLIERKRRNWCTTWMILADDMEIGSPFNVISCASETSQYHWPHIANNKGSFNFSHLFQMHQIAGMDNVRIQLSTRDPSISFILNQYIRHRCIIIFLSFCYNIPYFVVNLKCIVLIYLKLKARFTMICKMSQNVPANYKLMQLPFQLVHFFTIFCKISQEFITWCSFNVNLQLPFQLVISSQYFAKSPSYF